MKSLHTLSVLPLLLSATLASAQTHPTPDARLYVGDPAPAISVQAWVQGAPVTSFEKDHVYVLEFWATWCGPCIAAMPHLSKLSEQYKDKATFIGVNILERPTEEGVPADALALVSNFMTKNPGRMTYTVAVDGPQAFMAKNWFKAAGQSGIPCSIIVDQQGKIAWIGHPLKLDDVLPKVLAGNYEAVKVAAEEKARIATETALLKPIRDAYRAKNYAAALAAIAKLEQENPEVAKKADLEKLISTFHTAPDSVLDTLKQLREDKNLTQLRNYGIMLAMNPGLRPDLSTTAAEALESLSDDANPADSAINYSVTTTLYMNLGQTDKARQAAQKGLSLSQSNPDSRQTRFFESMLNRINNPPQPKSPPTPSTRPTSH